MPEEPYVLQIRSVITARLRGDTALMAEVDNTPARVGHRPVPLDVMPAVSFWDVVVHQADLVVPLEERIWQVDVVGSDLDQNERIAARVEALMKQGIQIPGVYRTCYMKRTRAFDSVNKDTGNTQTVREFRALAYHKQP